MELLNLLAHLWPDFEALANSTPQGLATLFWLLIVGIFLIATVAVSRHYLRFRRRLSALKRLISEQDSQALAANRRSVLQSAMALKNDEIGKLWREFDESLVMSSDQTSLHNTLDADHFFNAKTLAPGLTGSRLLAATPSFLVAIGVLGTFVGLTVGLDSLNLVSDSSTDELRSGIDNLIQGASVAFMTSVWGVGLSFLLNLIEKFLERSALGRIRHVQQSVDFLYPRIAAEQSLVHIADSSRESKEALQELHERIGDRLQESLEGVSESMQEAVSTALNQVMAPAIESLVNNASQQSTQVLERLVSDFVDGISGAANDQGKLLEKAATDVNAAVSDMSSQLGEVFSQLSEQQNQQLENSRRQNEKFDAQMQQVSESAASGQQAMEARFKELLSEFSTRVDDQLDASDKRNAQAVEQAMQHQEQVKDNMNGLADQMMDRLNAQFTAADEREAKRQQNYMEQYDRAADQQEQLINSIAESVRVTQQQGLELANQHRETLSQLEQATQSISSSSQHLDNSSNQLGILSSQVKQATDALGHQLTEAVSGIQSAGEQNVELSERLSEQSRLLENLQNTVRESIEQYGEAAKLTNEGFDALKEHQRQWLQSIHEEFSQLGDSLADQVSSIEKQAESWLNSYSSQVNQQMEDRMEKWNDSSRAYADSMLRIVENMSSILDELEAR